MKTALLNALRASVAAVAIAIGSMAAMAQEPYDEVDLIGKWTVEEQEGVINNVIIKISGFYLGDFDYLKISGDNSYYRYYGGQLLDVEFAQESGLDHSNFYSDEPIADFWISNGNKLHILLNPEYWYNPALRFIIDEWTGDKMVLKSYDGKSRIVVRKEADGPASAPSVIAEATRGGERIYNLNGQEVKNPESGLYIKRNGGEVKKVVVK
ncbi:MAG: hypothetical protein K2M12_09865 [Muribaculaceae bacterium]|nr:hypothetical protein [Muribaculaceae bacterium]